MAAARHLGSAVPTQSIARAKPQTFAAQVMALVTQASSALDFANASKQAGSAAQTADTAKRETSALSIVMVAMDVVRTSAAQHMFLVVSPFR